METLLAFLYVAITIIVLIVFFVMAANVKAMRNHSQNINQKLDRIIRNMGGSEKSVDEKARMYDERNTG